MKTKRIILAVSGASGTVYATALVRELGGRDDVDLHVIISDAARKVMALETDLPPDALTRGATAIHAPDDISAPPASGSWLHDGMIICPCSMATLSAVATGFGHTLIHRAADVTLKERKKLILVPRETPLSAIHLQNMLTADQAGAIVLPASPGFYHRPVTIEDLADQLAGKILDQLDIPHTLFKRWGE
ncbi:MULTISPECIES: UbiX family flavin prenyltransferase [unclassified Pseudodesulfovibrio]|uniref:UbiX family flavin prenyltransferase n=1 Tax=unclassified Pseudodesulfovibrio TaxID=2661612 RepID=UPI000FEBA4CF|nr:MULTISPECIES: UbiX family flavin prenyltransferase [unclassified Pseudodesulfovibrio]MCJ2164271.1 UbiX family flavin prenyltransferase [Pseudodesulfovibrio sp. S3-i]RWU05106.1 UbiX family flavin prenyltransferase [Pseudodesulfovibrio sp. S3]